MINKLTTFLGVITLSALTLSAAEVDRRLRSEHARITQGIRSGELTRPEALRLRTQERAIARQIHRDRIDGAGFTAAERARARQAEASLSRNIARQKHDTQYR